MSLYLLDSNAISDLIHHPAGSVAQHVGLVGSASIRTSIIVAAEIRYGVEKRNSERLRSRVDAVLGAIEILPFETPAEFEYGALRAKLERAGTMIGQHDLLIAAHALATGCTVVTDNEREFRRVPGLGVENWLRSV